MELGHLSSVTYLVKYRDGIQTQTISFLSTMFLCIAQFEITRDSLFSLCSWCLFILIALLVIIYIRKELVPIIFPSLPNITPVVSVKLPWKVNFPSVYLNQILVIHTNQSNHHRAPAIPCFIDAVLTSLGTTCRNHSETPRCRKTWTLQMPLPPSSYLVMAT